MASGSKTTELVIYRSPGGDEEVRQIAQRRPQKQAKEAPDGFHEFSYCTTRVVQDEGEWVELAGKRTNFSGKIYLIGTAKLSLQDAEKLPEKLPAGQTREDLLQAMRVGGIQYVVCRRWSGVYVAFDERCHEYVEVS